MPVCRRAVEGANVDVPIERPQVQQRGIAADGHGRFRVPVQRDVFVSFALDVGEGYARAEEQARFRGDPAPSPVHRFDQADVDARAIVSRRMACVTA